MKIADKIWPHQTSYWIDVKERGAIGDGITDDWSVIQQCLDAVDDVNIIGVYFPPGTYRCTRTLTLHEGVRLSGEPLFSTIHSEADVGLAFWNMWEDNAFMGTNLPPIEKCRPYKTGLTPIWQTREPPVPRNSFHCRGVRLYGIRIETPTRQCRFAAHTLGLHCSMTNIDECYFSGTVAGFVSTGDMIGSAIRNSTFHPGLWFLNKNPQSVCNTSVIERIHVGTEHNSGDDYALKFVGASQMLSIRHITMQGRKQGILWKTTGNGVASEIDGVFFCDACDLDGANPVGVNADEHRYGRVLDIQNAGMGLVVRNVMSFPTSTIHIARSAGPVWLTNVATCKVVTTNPDVRLDSGPTIILREGDLKKLRKEQLPVNDETTHLMDEMDQNIARKMEEMENERKKASKRRKR